jgi:hypothetical protein
MELSYKLAIVKSFKNLCEVRVLSLQDKEKRNIVFVKILGILQIEQDNGVPTSKMSFVETSLKVV